MKYVGNQLLLEQPLVAFFASRHASAEAEELARQWALGICQTEWVVVSGFHSPIEQVVLQILLAHRHPIIVALGREPYRRIPSRLKRAWEDGLLLFLSTQATLRHTLSSAQRRNWHVAYLAQQVVFAPFDRTSQLAALYSSLQLGGFSLRILGQDE